MCYEVAATELCRNGLVVECSCLACSGHGFESHLMHTEWKFSLKKKTVEYPLK